MIYKAIVFLLDVLLVVNKLVIYVEKNLKVGILMPWISLHSTIIAHFSQRIPFIKKNFQFLDFLKKI
jgi:hypothetical protein